MLHSCSEQQLAAVYGGRARQRGNGGQVDPGHLAQLRDMDFDSVSAEMALRMFHNHVEAAANWLLHARPMGDAAVPAVAAAAAAVPGNAASSSGAQQAAARQEGQDGQEEVMQQQAQREQQQGQSGLRQVGLRGDGLPPLVTSSDDDEAHAPQSEEEGAPPHLLDGSDSEHSEAASWHGAGRGGAEE